MGQTLYPILVTIISLCLAASEMSDKPPYVCDAAEPSSGRPATFIFIHGYDDDAEGIPLGMAQQFQYYKKMPYLRWLLPNAPIHKEHRARAWYKVKALPNSQKPRIPGHDDEEEGQEPDDEEGILTSCDRIDEWVQGELDRGVEPGRIIVGGFSQGCAVSLVWSLVGKYRDRVGGVFAASGYFPLAHRIPEIRQAKGIVDSEEGGRRKWLYVHGSKDLLVGTRYFEQGKSELKKWIADEDLEEHLYQGMGHSTSNAELRDLLNWLNKVIPP